MYYLYLKTHLKTHLKYLGMTTQDPFFYQGSGVYWKNHLKKHGRKVFTEILFETENHEEFCKKALEYSHKYKIKDSKEFANLCLEDGKSNTGWIATRETRTKMSKPKSRETRTKMSKPKSKTHREKLRKNIIKINQRERTKEERMKLSEGQKKTKQKCPHCDFYSTLSHVKRHLKRNVCG